jgi:hypothetical protein
MIKTAPGGRATAASRRKLARVALATLNYQLILVIDGR